VVKRGDVEEFIEADRVVVAAGTVESAKLLLRSKSHGWAAGLGNRTDHVGRYLITHPYFVFKGEVKSNPLRLQKEMDFPTLCSRHFDSPAEQKAGKFLLVSPPDTGDPKVLAMMKEGKSRAQIDAAIEGKQTLAMHGMLEVFGRFSNRLSVAPGKSNRMGLPQTIIDFTKDVGFDARIEQIQVHADAIFKQMDATTSGKPSVSWRADHAASPCRMGSDEAISVVDANLRVHGVDNVFVCSNATFPSLGAVNPTLTLTALAFKLGDHLSPPTTTGSV
jgi:choline dehydrogenase-like flavoprotein